MCLSTIYLNEVKEEEILMENCVKIESVEEEIVLTDLMDRIKRVKGYLKCAHLTDGYAVIGDRK